MYQVGIVGCGVIGSRLATAIDEHERVELRGACDRVAEKAATMASTYGCESVTAVEDLLELEGLDIVYVGVPPKHHAPVVRAALEAEKHVICEKPIAENAVVGQKLVDLADESDRTTAINFPFRYTPGFRALQARIEAGDIGTPKRVSLRFRFPQWPREWQDVEWLRHREQGGPLREVGSHFIFGTQELFGDLVEIDSKVEYTGPDTYESSIVATFSLFDSSDRGVEEPIHGTIDLCCGCAGSEENSLTIEGTEGSLSLQAWRRLVANPGEPDEQVLTEEPGATTTRLLDAFVDELEGAGEDGALVTFEEATRVQAVVDAVFDNASAADE